MIASDSTRWDPSSNSRTGTFPNGLRAQVPGLPLFALPQIDQDLRQLDDRAAGGLLGQVQSDPGGVRGNRKDVELHARVPSADVIRIGPLGAGGRVVAIECGAGGGSPGFAQELTMATGTTSESSTGSRFRCPEPRRARPTSPGQRPGSTCHLHCCSPEGAHRGEWAPLRAAPLQGSIRFGPVDPGRCPGLVGRAPAGLRTR